MSRPMTLDDAFERELTAGSDDGIHTFSNGTDWECWADQNCYRCRWWNPDVLGEACAFEGAAFMHRVSPALAAMFGWVQDKQYDRPRDHRHGWAAPQQCAFWTERSENDGDDTPTLPLPDPDQLNLIADPSEDAALIRSNPLSRRPEQEPAR